MRRGFRLRSDPSPSPLLARRSRPRKQRCSNPGLFQFGATKEGLQGRKPPTRTTSADASHAGYARLSAALSIAGCPYHPISSCAGAVDRAICLNCSIVICAGLRDRCAYLLLFHASGLIGSHFLHCASFKLILRDALLLAFLHHLRGILLQFCVAHFGRRFCTSGKK